MRPSRLTLTALLLCVLLVAGALAASGSEIEDDDEVDLTADLTGDAEIPDADPDGSGEADIEIDLETNQVCFDIEWEDIAAPTAGHIHEAPADANGPVVVGLLDGFTLDELEADDEAEACVSGDAAVLLDIATNPGNFYVNLHNARFPGGVLRGQLAHD